MYGKEATEQVQLTRKRPHSLELFVDGTKGSSGRGEYLFSYLTALKLYLERGE